jgi:kynurenine formamidase
MYNLVNQFAKEIIGTIKSDHVTEYEWLLQNVEQASKINYRKRYRNYWAINAARLSSSFDTVYFDTLAAAPTEKPTLSAIVHRALLKKGALIKNQIVYD